MRKIFLTINTDTADLRYNDTPQDAITNPADCPQIYAGEEVIFCCTFIGEDLQPVSFAETDTFDIGIDQNFDHADDLMAYTNTFNAAGDWDEASLAAGKLSFRVSTATTGTVEKLANSASLQVKLEIRQFSTGSALPSILCQAPAVMHNSVIGTAASTEEAEVFATANQVNAAKSTADTALANAATAQSTADTALADAATAQSTADTALADAATAQSTADTALANAATAQSTANTALANAATAQNTADTALANAAAAQTAANSKLTAPAAAGTAGQVLTLNTDGVTPIWANPTGGGGGGGGLTKWSASGLETREIDTQYTATQDGYIIFNITGKLMANTYLRLIIDGVEVASSINYDPANVKSYGSSFLVPVFSGQTYILEYGSYIMGDYGWNLYFAPCV